VNALSIGRLSHIEPQQQLITQPHRWQCAVK